MTPVDVRAGGGLTATGRGAVEVDGIRTDAPREFPLPTRVPEILAIEAKASASLRPDVGIAVEVAVGAETKRDGGHELAGSGCAPHSCPSAATLDAWSSSFSAAINRPRKRFGLRPRQPGGQRLEKVEAAVTEP